jgi:hypothetical protein
MPTLAQCANDPKRTTGICRVATQRLPRPAGGR